MNTVIIMITKLAIKVLKLFGRGTALPGSIALKII